VNLFKSKLEKRLWFCTLAILFAIYATAGIAHPISYYLREKGLLTIIFITGFSLILIALFLVGIKNKPNTIVIGTLFGVIGVYTLVFVRIEIPEERTHVIEYSIVAALIYQALLERKKRGGHSYYPAILTILVTSIMGLIDEVIQYVLPNRIFDFKDILFNTLSGLLAVGSSIVLSWAQKRIVL
jgi:hypothetical protein